MNPLRQAIYDRLTGDATLVALLADGVNGVHHQVAPREANEPLVVFHKQAGSDRWAFGARALEPQLWLVKATDRSLSAAQAEAIARRIDDLLTDAPLPLTEGTVLSCRRETHVDYPEQDGADVFHHVGGLYRITVEP